MLLGGHNNIQRAGALHHSTPQSDAERDKMSLLYRKLRIEARSNMEKNVNRAGFGGWFPSLFVVSSRVMYRKVIGQAIGSMQEMDEGSTQNGLIGWIYTEAKKSTQKQ